MLSESAQQPVLTYRTNQIGCYLYTVPHLLQRCAFTVTDSLPCHWAERVPAPERSAESNQHCSL